MTVYNVGNVPPQIVWTIVRGDSAVFKVYVTDDDKAALDLENWTIDLEIKRLEEEGYETKVALQPAPLESDTEGFFTVRLLPEESEDLQTEDVFDIQLYDGEDTIWTVAQGQIVMIEDITGPPTTGS